MENNGEDETEAVLTCGIGEIISYGAGDSFLITSVYPESDVSNLFQMIKEEVHWQEMMHKGSPVPRLIAIQVRHANELELRPSSYLFPVSPQLIQ